MGQNIGTLDIDPPYYIINKLWHKTIIFHDWLHKTKRSFVIMFLIFDLIKLIAYDMEWKKFTYIQNYPIQIMSGEHWNWNFFLVFLFILDIFKWHFCWYIVFFIIKIFMVMAIVWHEMVIFLTVKNNCFQYFC